jgi:23S rRNA pseudouridine955/2504/2580 synthase
MKELIITPNEAEQRIDRFLKKFIPKASKGFIYKMIRKKRIKINGVRVSPDYILQIDDTIQLYLSEDTIEGFRDIKQIISFEQLMDIVYEDDNILLVNKPKGLLVHGDYKENKNTLINQIYYYLNKKGTYKPKEENTFSPACCNRLDRNTSGIIIVAKNYPSLQAVNSMIKEDKIVKKYLALVKGRLYKKEDLKGFILKDRKTNKVEIIPQEKKGSKFIHTKYNPIIHNENFTLLEINLITGRSHQIRAHLASEGYPIIGDYKYGNKEVNSIFYDKFKLNSQFLHAYFIQFQKCPSFLTYLEGKSFKVSLPNDLKKITGTMGWEEK